MDQKEIRKCKIRRRSLFLRCRYDRRIISGLIAIAIVLAVCMGRMFRMTHIWSCDGSIRLRICSPAQRSRYLCTDRSRRFCGRCGCHRYLYAVSKKEGKQYLQ